MSNGDSYNVTSNSPKKYKLVASNPMLTISIKSSLEIEPGFGNLVSDNNNHVTISQTFQVTCFLGGERILVDVQKTFAIGVHGCYKHDQVTFHMLHNQA